jgi:hypothetical protein
VPEKQPIMNENSTKKDIDQYELREEYDLARLPIMPKGRYAPGHRLNKNIVVLAPDVVDAFPDDEAVNTALRLVMQLAKLPHLQEMLVQA